MKNVERIEKIILVNGIPQKVIMEIDSKETAIINKHLANIRKMKEIQFNTSGISTLGRGKKTGNMAKSQQAKLFKGNKTRTETRANNQKRVNEAGTENYYSLHLPQF